MRGAFIRLLFLAAYLRMLMPFAADTVPTYINDGHKGADVSISVIDDLGPVEKVDQPNTGDMIRLREVQKHS